MSRAGRNINVVEFKGLEAYRQCSESKYYLYLVVLEDTKLVQTTAKPHGLSCTYLALNY
jgi:hypothetical protein